MAHTLPTIEAAAPWHGIEGIVAARVSAAEALYRSAADELRAFEWEAACNGAAVRAMDAKRDAKRARRAARATDPATMRERAAVKRAALARRIARHFRMA